MDKLYSISKAAEILDVTPKTLRLWDKEGKLKPVLTSGKHRRYTETDLNNFIKRGCLPDDETIDRILWIWTHTNISENQELNTNDYIREHWFDEFE